MAKRKKKFKSTDWISAYKAYLMEHGDLVENVKALLEFADRPFSEFGEYFDSLEELEIHLVVDYFSRTLQHLQKDEEFEKLDKKEQQLAFLYVLIELAAEDELFLRLFYKHRSKDASFILKMQKALSTQELPWAKLSSWRPDFIDDLNIIPKRSVLINHALSCLWFFVNDKSDDKQDTDAYIEKSTDLLFKLSDTSTLHSLIDFGKFFYSRTKQKMF